MLVLVLDALMLLAADSVTGGDLSVDGFWAALAVALVAAAVSIALGVLFGVDDDDTYSLRVIERIARRSKDRVATDAPGIVFLEIDGLALPVLQRAMRDGSAPNMARWLDERHAPVRGVGDRPVVADGRVAGRHPARLERRHPGLPVGREGEGDDDGLLGARRTARRSSAATRRGEGCSSTAARAAGISSPARPTT